MPDEKILWCVPIKPVGGKVKRVYYAVSGLDERGDRRWTAGKIVGGVASGVAGLALEVVSPSEGDAVDNSPRSAPWVVVSGRKRDCLAAARLADWQETGANAERGDKDFLWFLTTHRLGLLRFDRAGSTDAGQLLGGLRKAVGRYFGGQEEDPSSSSAPQQPELPRPVLCAEIQRQEIASVEKVVQKVRGVKNLPYLRVALVDGSSIDITEGHDDAKVERLLAMSHGRE
ncbi:hypothetical protein GCM10025787_33690 [Saccharopolyspora rosea]